MYPVLFRIGEFEITSFGVLVAVGALVGLWLFRRELRRSGLPDTALDAAVAGVVGGMAGAKLLWVFEHLGEEPFIDLLLSRGGMSWFGGFAGGHSRWLVDHASPTAAEDCGAGRRDACVGDRASHRQNWLLPRRRRLRTAITAAVGRRLSARLAADHGARASDATLRGCRLSSTRVAPVPVAAAETLRHLRARRVSCCWPALFASSSNSCGSMCESSASFLSRIWHRWQRW